MRLFVLIAVVLFAGITYSQEWSKEELNQLLQDVTVLSHDSLEGRETGTKGEKIAAEYIARRFKEIGLHQGEVDSYFQYFEKKTRAHPHDNDYTGPILNGTNIIGFIDNDAEYTIVIGAHYDHLGWGAEGSLDTSDVPSIHNGADDNASGIASLLFLANRLMKIDASYNFKFIAFSGEEKGLLGSNHFVTTLGESTKNINFMVNMDMVGRLDKDRRLAIYGVGTSDAFIHKLYSIESPAFNFALDSSGLGPSDHASFYLNDVPVLHFFTGQHEQYHRPEDDVELINFEGLADVSVFIEKLVIQFVHADKLSFSKTKDKTSKRGSFKVTLGIMPDYLFTGKGLKIDGVKEDRPAAKAGLKKNDVITQIGEYPIQSMQDYMEVLQKFDPGDKTKVTILRDDKSIEVNLTF